MSTGEPDATESGHVRFGGGPSEKDQVTWHLVGGLPYCLLGSEGGCAEKARTHTGPGPRRAAHPVTLPGRDDVRAKEVSATGGPVAAQVKRTAGWPMSERESP